MAGREKNFDLSRLSAQVHWLEISSSTNDYLRRLGRRLGPQIAITWNQTAGRGRMGRAWVSPAGKSLAISLDLGHLVPNNPGDSWRGVLPLLIASELARQIRSFVGAHAEVKWPNDVWINGGKVAGILGEIPEDGRVIIGIGINVWGIPGGLGEASVTSLSAHGLKDRDTLRAVIFKFVEASLRNIEAIRDTVPPDYWDFVRSHLSTLGQRVRCLRPGGAEIVGFAENLDSSGRLIVRTVSGFETISAGDIEHLRVV